MAEIILQPTTLSKIIPLSFDLNDTNASNAAQLMTKRQFNTADTDAWFQVTLDGFFGTAGSFDITLFNLNDKSVFNHTGKPFATNPFYYKLDSGSDETTNEIRHAGRWIGQIVVTLTNGDSATRKFIFDIEDHILDGADVQTILLEDYNALIATINTSKDLLAQYNVDYAALLVDLAAAETARTATYNQLVADQQANIDAFDVALETGIVAANLAEKLEDFEEINNSRLLSTERQLADKADESALLSLSNQLADKADESALLSLSNQLADKADESALLSLSNQLADKADESALLSLSNQLADKADESALLSLSNQLADKADESALLSLSNQLADKADESALLSLSNQLADKADESALLSLSNQLAQTVEDVELAHSKIKRNNENTFGTFENAAVESIIANDASARPEVLGISLENDHMLATYTNRDSVASYRSNRTRKPTYNIDNVKYTVNSVTVPIGIDLSKIKNGMIIDTKHNPKFSGFIVGVEGQKILINNWYKMGNTSKGQVPSGTTGILVDPMTTPWVDNANLYLDAEDDSLDGVVFEAGIINEKADNIGKGVNVVSLGTKSPEVGFKTTGGSSPFIQGFNAGNSRTAFTNSNANVNDFLLYNEKTGYRIKNGGLQNKFLLEIAYASTNRTFDPRNAPIFLIDTPGIVKILSPSGMRGAIVYVLNIQQSEILMEWSYWNPADPGSIRIPAKGMKTLVSDGGTWYHF